MDTARIVVTVPKCNAGIVTHLVGAHLVMNNYARTDVFKFSFFNIIVDMWNVLPSSVRQALNIQSLIKRKVREFFSSRND